MVYSDTFVIKNITCFDKFPHITSIEIETWVYMRFEFQIIFFFCLTKDENDSAILYDALLAAMHNNKKFRHYLHIMLISENICIFLLLTPSKNGYTNTMVSFKKAIFLRFTYYYFKLKQYLTTIPVIQCNKDEHRTE